MMTVITESELREIWKNGRGNLPPFPLGTRFSASAQDFIKSHQIELIFEGDANAEIGQAGHQERSQLGSWDKPGAFPVILTGPSPVCQECGQPLTKKPDYFTQIDAGHFAVKTSPRLVFRGRVDSLHAIVMLVSTIARRFELPTLAGHLDTIAAYCREIMSAEYNQRPVASLTLMGKNEDQLHEISHWPDKYIGIPHIVPGPHDHEILHWLNLLRTQCREVEIVALQVFPPSAAYEAQPGIDLPHSLNRLSSAIYVLELFFQAGILNWKIQE
jgi:ethanolamine utilization cobalamin adenosyltransferase